MSSFQIVIFIILGIMLGILSSLVIFKLKSTKDSEETKKVIESCFEDLVGILNLAIETIDEKSFTDELEYQEAITKLVIAEFKKFLKKNKVLPSYVVNSLSDELFYVLIDKAINIVEEKMKNKEIEQFTETIIEEENNKTEIEKMEETKTDISSTISNFYD